VEFTHQVRAQKPELPVNQALLEACPVRLRPILMTSVATIAAAVPEAIDFGAGAETRIPMAVTVIGGVLVSTVLTLFVVPSVYSVFSSPWAGRWRSRHEVKRGDIGVGAASGISGLLLLFGSFEAHALSLKEALDRGLKAHPSVRVAEERIQEADALESSAFARHFPTLSVNGNAYTRKDAAIAGNAAFGGEAFNLYQVQLQGSVPIFRGFAFTGAQATARVDEELRRVELELSNRALSMDIIEAYLGVLREQSRVQAFESRLRLDDGLLRLGRERERIGRSQRLDVLQIQAQIALFKPQFMQAQAERDLQLARLRAALGVLGSEDPGTPSGELRKIAGREVREWLAREGYQKAAPALLEVRQTELGLERVSAQNQVLLAPHWPTLNAVGTVASNSFSRSELFDPYAASWTAGVELSIPLYTGLSVFSDFRAKQARTETALYQKEQAVNAVGLEQARTERSLGAAYDMDRLASEAESISQKVLAEARRNFSLSTIDYQQLLNVQRDALQAELMAITARFELANAAARWIAARSLGLAPFVEFLDQALSGGNES
jgi:outer membrane protein TolC